MRNWKRLFWLIVAFFFLRMWLAEELLKDHPVLRVVSEAIVVLGTLLAIIMYTERRRADRVKHVQRVVVVKSDRRGQLF